ncbi:Zinc finger HIT domain-containing protein 1 [Fasciolopsis buskii]|uniref:Zinc finger HIT domain-containing protein 1 n=1 Tax=Fasciolopsis buskii TaxID=27845 RepID=A0A8E0VRR9_9TREM|nr:Zinc finger HIT domain-containing protein 1 [Fasciolopsis buski]
MDNVNAPVGQLDDSGCVCIKTKEDPTPLDPCDPSLWAPKDRPDGIPQGAKTSDYYKVAENLPIKFNEPDLFHGYDRPPGNPLYRTTNSEYGRLKPNVHTMNSVYHTRSHDFTKRYGPSGNYRNHSLNTAMDQKII